MTENNWYTPTRDEIRTDNREYIEGSLSVPLVVGDVPRVLADANGALAHLNLLYLDFLSRQFLPLTANGEYLDKISKPYLGNSDNTSGRKTSTYASGSVSISAEIAGTIIPSGTRFYALANGQQVLFETIYEYAISTAPTSIQVRSLTPGVIGNLPNGSTLSLISAIPGIANSASGSATVISLLGGADEETDDQLRARILLRLRNSPMSGDATDYEQWALSVPQVTRAWCSPNELGPGSVTVRIMTDGATPNGIPTAEKLQEVLDFINTVRPVTVFRTYVLAPKLKPINFTVAGLVARYGDPQQVATKAAINTAVANIIAQKSRPARAVNGTLTPATTVTAQAIGAAIAGANGVRDFDLRAAGDKTQILLDFVPTDRATLFYLGNINYQ